MTSVFDNMIQNKFDGYYFVLLIFLVSNHLHQKKIEFTLDKCVLFFKSTKIKMKYPK